MDDPLLGRASEQALLSGVLDRIMAGAQSRSARSSGPPSAPPRVLPSDAEALTPAPSAVVLTGAPGIGKSALLQHVGELASRHDVLVLRAHGVESEMSFPYAGIHQLSRTVLDLVADDLPAEAALLRSSASAEPQGAAVARVAMALLDVLLRLATVRPVLVLVDDAHWLDAPSWEVLGFIARRLGPDAVAVVVAVRTNDALVDSDRSGLALTRWASGAAFAVQAVPPLDTTSARALLMRAAPELRDDLRVRILAEADGNPLAIVELPHALTTMSDHAEVPAWLPLTTRLEQEFASRLHGLPDRTSALLLVAAADQDDDLRQLLAAATHLAGTSVQLDDLAPATRVGLVEVVDGRRLRFAHTLMRSAVYQHAGATRRHAAHAAWAHLARSDRDRRTMHRALCTTGVDDSVADDLIALSQRRSESGDAAGAMSALERAAAFAATGARRAELELEAADLGLGIGRLDVMARLVHGIDTTVLSRGRQLRVVWLRELLRSGQWSGDERLLAIVDMVDRLHGVRETEQAMLMLTDSALRMWWSNPSPEARRRVVEAAERISSGPSDWRLLHIYALAAPREKGRVVLQALQRSPISSFATDADTLNLAGTFLGAVGDYRGSLEPLQWAGDLLRRVGRLGKLVQAVTSLAWSQVHVGLIPRAQASAEEAIRLAAERSDPLWGATAALAAATASARRGDLDAVEELVIPAEKVMVEIGAHPMLAMVQYARGAAAIAAGRYPEAFDQLARIFDPSDIAHHIHYGTHVIADFVDAAVHGNRQDEVLPFYDEMTAYAEEAAPPLLLANLAFARPLLSEPERAENEFERSLAMLASWPLLRARTQLAYGSWLRRNHRAADARPRLRSAHETFVVLGTLPWAQTARGELRAAGEQVTRPAERSWEQLTPQELQIAMMAARGLSNREIAAALFLSPRTVSTHLYRIYPKVGVTSRGQLAAALGPVALADLPI